MIEPGRSQTTIWRMRITCWINKATNTHSEYVIIIAFSLQQWLHERASMLHYSTLGEKRGVYRALVGKPEGRRPLGRPRRRWVDNVRMDLQEMECGYVDWIGLAQDRDRWRTFVIAVMNLRVL